MFNLKRLLSKVGVRGLIGSAAAAIAFFREENQYNPEIEKQVYKYIKEQGFEFEVNENYMTLYLMVKYVVNRDIYNLEGDVVINSGDTIDYNEDIQTIMESMMFSNIKMYI